MKSQRLRLESIKSRNTRDFWRATRSWEEARQDSSLDSSEKTYSLDKLISDYFRLFRLKVCKRIDFFYFKPSVCTTLLILPQETSTPSTGNHTIIIQLNLRNRDSRQGEMQIQETPGNTRESSYICIT